MTTNPAKNNSRYMTNKTVYVTQPHLPPLEEFIPYLQRIWENKTLTNNGPFHQEFERALCEFLGVEHLALFTNGTIALVTALQTLRITGEVITTPYCFVPRHILSCGTISSRCSSISTRKPATSTRAG